MRTAPNDADSAAGATLQTAAARRRSRSTPATPAATVRQRLPTMPFSYPRTVRFADTDAAGVVFFANFYALCHEAYEEALAGHGIELQRFFTSTGVVVPIARSEAEYLRPLHPGDKLRITVTPEPLTEHSFAIRYEIHRLGPPEKLAARVRTEHVATSPAQRGRVPLPPALAAWVQAG